MIEETSNSQSRIFEEECLKRASTAKNSLMLKVDNSVRLLLNSINYLKEMKMPFSPARNAIVDKMELMLYQLESNIINSRC